MRAMEHHQRLRRVVARRRLTRQELLVVKREESDAEVSPRVRLDFLVHMREVVAVRVRLEGPARHRAHRVKVAELQLLQRDQRDLHVAPVGALRSGQIQEETEGEALSREGRVLGLPGRPRPVPSDARRGEVQNVSVADDRRVGDDAGLLLHLEGRLAARRREQGGVPQAQRRRALIRRLIFDASVAHHDREKHLQPYVRVLGGVQCRVWVVREA